MFQCGSRDGKVTTSPSVAGGRTIVFAGGMPLERDGVLIGAVGDNGGDAMQDRQAVEAGIRAFVGR